MTSAIGQGTVLAALACAIVGAALGIGSGLLRKTELLPWVRRCAYGFSGLMVLANLVMEYALITHDFSVKYVAQVGSRVTPLHITIVSLWSALEGSILFWGAILGVYLFVYVYANRKETARPVHLGLGVMLAVSAFFAFLIAGPAEPWVLKGPIPADGPGPNPLLQNHPLMIIHPPALYLGFVGMTIPFGLAAGALLAGELGHRWVSSLRKWTMVPWMFLTMGIVFGAWWAYAVLGWGGYWAWDPVENASYHPWLVGVAFLHSAMVLERRRMLKLWTIVLGVSTFWLTIVGTFMTRSGVFNSVHAFTQSNIGPTFLVFIAIVALFIIVLLAFRGYLLVAEQSIESVFSREVAVLLMNLLITAKTFAVFFGTVYPLVVEAVFKKRISIGEPYFNAMAVPLSLAVLFLMGAGLLVPWGKGDVRSALRRGVVPAALAVLQTIVCAAVGINQPAVLLTFALATFAAVVTVMELLSPVRERLARPGKGESAATAAWRGLSLAPRRTGGYLVHLAIIAVIVAVAASKNLVVHTTGTIEAGKTLALGDYQVRFDRLISGSDPHRRWTAAEVTVLGPNGSAYTLAGASAPRMNFYPRSNDPVGSPAIVEKLTKDIYLNLLAFDPDKKTASFNAWVFPLVGWIWYTLPVIALGCLIALWTPKRRSTVAATDAATASGNP